MNARHIILLLAILFISANPIDAKRKPTLYTIGDSTMAEKDTTKGNPERGWMMQFRTMLDTSDISISNLAKNGRSSKSFRSEGVWDQAFMPMKKGDFLFIQFGHNDQKEDTLRHTEPHTSFKNNIVRYITEARSKGATPILFTSIVRRHFDEQAKLVDSHGDYVKVIYDVAKEQKVTLIDLNYLTHQYVEALGPEDSKALYKWVAPNTLPAFPKGFEDDTHLNETGAKAVAIMAAEALMQSDSKIKKYIKR
ncbi:MAG: rhamnogalacturonan acetylesterase [Bacteroidales bacterium]